MTDGIAATEPAIHKRPEVLKERQITYKIRCGVLRIMRHFD